MKILCVCQRGSVRSNAMAHLLKNKGHEAIAMGWETARPGTQKMLVDWADIIFLAEDYMKNHIPEHAQSKKVINVGIGPDVWGFENSSSLLKEVGPLVESALIESYTRDIWNK